MNHEIPATSKERRLTAAALEQRGMNKGRTEALLALAAQLLTPDELAALETTKDPVELERRLVELLRRH